MSKKGRTIKKNCSNCYTQFDAEIKELNRGNAKFCSRSCGTEFRWKEWSSNIIPNVTCANCGKEFYKNKSSQKNSKSGLFFCTRSCKNSAQKIGGIKDIQPAHYGTSNGKSSYRKIAFETFPSKCNRCNYDKHIEILTVHHIDRNRENNHHSNLEILCPTCHYEEHFLAGDGIYWNRD